MQHRTSVIAALIIYGLIVVLFVAAMIGWGNPLRDEGWYSLAAKQFVEGSLPYRDFFFSQAPGSLPVYGVPYLVFGSNLLVGRIVSALFFLAAMLLCTVFLLKRNNYTALWFFLPLVGLNPHLVRHSTLVLTTGFEVFFLTAIFLLLRNEGSFRRAAVAVSLAAVATWFRISYAVVLLTVWMFVVWRHPALRHRLLLTLAPVAVLVFGFVPLIAASGIDRFLFQTVGYHTSSFGSSDTVVFSFYPKIVFAQKALKYYFPILIATTAAVVFLRRKPQPVTWLMIITVALLAGAQLASTVPYPKYIAAAMALIALPVSEALAESMAGRRRLIVGVITAVVLAGAAIGIYHPLKIHAPFSPTEYPRAVAGDVNRIANGKPVMTLDSRLMFSGLLNFEPGFEMDMFSVVLDADDPFAEKNHLQNRRMILEKLTDPALRFLVLRDFQEFGFNLPPDDPIMQEIRRSYRRFKVYPQYGQYSRDLTLFIHIPPKPAKIPLSVAD